jgi:hypothetical protein
MSETKVIKVAVLVTADTKPKYLSWALDAAFQYDPNILQFVVGYGWLEDADATEASLWDALASDTAERLTEPEPDDDTEES